MEWNMSSSLVSPILGFDGLMRKVSSARPNKLCAKRISSEETMALPRRSDGKCNGKDLKLERVFPKTKLHPLALLLSLFSDFFIWVANSLRVNNNRG